MLTWQLWNLIQIPSAHPMYRRAIRLGRNTEHLGWIIPVMGLITCCALWNWLARLRLSASLLILMLLIFFSASFYVLGWVIHISMSIAKEHEHETFDQLSLPPAGALGVSWAFASASIHRNDTFGWISSLRMWSMAGIGMIAFSVLFTSVFAPTGPDITQFLLIFVQVVSLLTLSYLDHVQSIVQGCLVGMLTPTFVFRRLDVRFLCILGFLASQVAIYVVWILIGFVALPFIINTLNLSGWFTDVSLTLLRVALFYSLREGMIILLWRLLIGRLNADPQNEWFFFSTAV